MADERQLQQRVVLAQAGDREALESLFEAVQAPLLRYLTRLVRDRVAAEDLLQETLFLIYRKIRWLREPELFRPWAYRIASREAFAWLRRAKQKGEEELTGDMLATLPAQPVALGRFEVEELMERLDRLTAKGRAVIVMHYLEEMSLEDVAAALDVPVGTAKSRLAYSLAILRKPERKSDERG